METRQKSCLNFSSLNSFSAPNLPIDALTSGENVQILLFSQLLGPASSMADITVMLQYEVEPELAPPPGTMSQRWNLTGNMNANDHSEIQAS